MAIILDETDLKILKTLQKNARCTILCKRIIKDTVKHIKEDLHDLSDQRNLFHGNRIRSRR